METNRLEELSDMNCDRINLFWHRSRIRDSIQNSRGWGGSWGQVQMLRDWTFGRYTAPRQPQAADLPEDRLLPDCRNLALMLNQIEQHQVWLEFNKLLKRFFPPIRTDVHQSDWRYTPVLPARNRLPYTGSGDTPFGRHNPFRRTCRNATRAFASTLGVYRRTGIGPASRRRFPSCRSHHRRLRANAAHCRYPFGRAGIRSDRETRCCRRLRSGLARERRYVGWIPPSLPTG